MHISVVIISLQTAMMTTYNAIKRLSSSWHCGPAGVVQQHWSENRVLQMLSPVWMDGSMDGRMSMSMSMYGYGNGIGSGMVVWYGTCIGICICIWICNMYIYIYIYIHT